MSTLHETTEISKIVFEGVSLPKLRQIVQFIPQGGPASYK